MGPSIPRRETFPLPPGGSGLPPDARDPYGRDVTIGDWIRERASMHAERELIDVLGVARSCAALDRDSARVATGLVELGLERGDRACLMMKTSVEYLDVWFAMCKAGIVEVPINSAYRGFLLRHIVGECEASAIVLDEAFVPMLGEVLSELPLLEHIVINGDPAAGDCLSAGRQIHALRDLYAEPTAHLPVLSRSDPVAILYTSGTTGAPKGVVKSHEAMLRTAQNTVSLLEYGPDDVLYTMFPLFHVNAKCASVMASIEAGARLVMHDRFSASRFWEICREHGVTAFNCQGMMLVSLWKQPARASDRLHNVRVSTGGPCPPQIFEPFERRFGLRLVEMFGMTETGYVLQNTIDRRRIGSLGKEMENYEVRVFDEHDQEVDRGVQGEIVVRPKQPNIMFSEYYKLPEATVDAWRNLWFHTGDLARMDDDGYVYFLGRAKDTIRRRGENVSAWEVERVVNQHTGVLESAAYGVDSELSEEEVMVAVVLQPDRRLTPEALLDHCQGRMAFFALPRYVRFVTELPKTPSQKIQKLQLRAEGVTPDAWDREDAGYVVRR
jgi:crotonobetaine/carnitine-CoA ligase